MRDKGCPKLSDNYKKDRSIAIHQSLKIAGIYFILGCIWIVSSDKIVETAFSDSSVIIIVSVLKGWAYVLVTSILFFCLIFKAMYGIVVGKAKIQKMNQVLKEKERLLNESQKLAQLCSYAMDLKSRMWEGSQQIYEILGNDETCSHTLKEFLNIVHPDYRKEILRYHRKMIKQKKCFEYEYKINRVSDGAERWIQSFGNVELDNEGNPVRLIGTMQDITKRKKAEEEILYLSYHDKLTGLNNRRYYEEKIKALDTKKNLPISIIIGDVNGLKLINDAFGHEKGDELLQKAAAAIISACRKGDIIARWGGDEFVILLPHTDAEEVQKIIQKIKVHYSKEYVSALKISMSFGWDVKTKCEENIYKVLKNAEDMMYKHKIVENEAMRSNAINTIIRTLHEKNPREEAHSKRVSEISQSIGKAMKLSDTEIRKLKTIGLLHDIGKIAIEEGILNKPGALSEDEKKQIKRHPDIGYRILSTSMEMVELAECVLAHHERWDGKGYPKGLKGISIPKEARIIALADSFDAMISERPYRKSLSKEEILTEIKENAGKQFDPEITRLFIEEVIPTLII